jgi:O-antigen/teichoic acid export membrane protein
MKRILDFLKSVLDKGFFHLLSANFIIGIVGFGSQLFVAKILSPLELGQIKTLQSFVNVAILIAGFGFNTSVLKMCSEERSDSEKGAILKGSLVWSIIPIVATLFALTALSAGGILSPDPGIKKWMPLYMWTIPSGAVIALFMAYLQALKKIQEMALLQIAIRCAGVICLVFFTYSLGLPGFIACSVIIGYVAIIPLYAKAKDALKEKSDYMPFFSQSFYYASWSVAANVVSTVGSFMDIFMLNYLASDRAGLGYYSLATIFIMGMSYITSTVQSIATPYFSEKSGSIREFLRAVNKYQKIMITGSFVTSILAAIAVPAFVTFVYGADYAPANDYFRILIFKHFFWSCFALLGSAILGLGKMKYNFIATSLSIGIAMALSYFLIHRHGFIGAAYAQAVTYFLVLIIMNLMFKKVTGDMARQ